MKQLHRTQKQLLELLKNNMEDPLTIRELQDLLEVSSPSVVSHHIRQLEKKGYLKRNPHNPKDYQILTEPEKPIVYLNLYGLAHCGPEGSLLDGNPKDRIPIASRLVSFPAVEAFLVEAKGDSMEPRIKEGDLVIAKKTQVPNNGDSVVCVYKKDAIYQMDDHIILQSENNNYSPIVAGKDEVSVEGVVKGSIQYN
jgi:repressor LexA